MEISVIEFQGLKLPITVSFDLVESAESATSTTAFIGNNVNLIYIVPWGRKRLLNSVLYWLRKKAKGSVVGPVI